MSLSSLLGGNLRDKNYMKSDLSPAKGDVSVYKFFVREKIKEVKVSKIIGYTRAINDSFILGHASNGVLGTSKLGDRRGSKTKQFEVVTNI